MIGGATRDTSSLFRAGSGEVRDLGSQFSIQLQIARPCIEDTYGWWQNRKSLGISVCSRAERPWARNPFEISAGAAECE